MIAFEHLNTVIKKGWQIFAPDVDPNLSEDANLTTIELIKKYGYSAESYSVVTEDEYILESHRISGSSKYPPRKGKKVCFLQHGVLDSSSAWILFGPDNALGYKLADEGYDVWLGNSRGNVYSTKHTTLNPYSILPWRRRKYWYFTWHEMGVYDLPTSIEFILKKTRESKLHYIGHSQGTTAFFVMLSPVLFIAKFMLIPNNASNVK